MTSLHHQLLSAHDRQDKHALVDLYTRAADETTHVDETCFFLTQAYVFALEVGHKKAEQLAKKLQGKGRL